MAKGKGKSGGSGFGPKKANTRKMPGVKGDNPKAGGVVTVNPKKRMPGTM